MNVKPKIIYDENYSKNYVIWIFASDSACIGCLSKKTTEEPKVELERDANIKEGSPNTYKVSAQEAQEIVEDFMSDHHMLKTSHQTDRTIESVELMDSTVYIVDFNDMNGYAVVSSDSRTTQMLAFVENGTLEDTANHPGMVIFLNHLGDFLAYEKLQYQKLEDSLFAVWTIQDSLLLSKKTPIPTRSNTVSLRNAPDYDDDYDDDPSSDNNPAYVYDRTVSYRLHSEIKEPIFTYEWNQYSPYNNHVPLSCGGQHAPAGCVAIALGQIMTYHKHCNGKNYNWQAMSNTDKADFVAYIGNRVDMDYDCDGSASTRKKALKSLKNDFGYAASDIQDYNFKAIQYSLRNNRPVYVGGSRSKRDILLFPIYSGGHAWVVNGFKDQFRNKEIIYTHPTYGYTIDHRIITVAHYRFVYVNWGWGNGHGNGWFVDGAFQSKLGTYQYDLEMITEIRKK